MNDIEDIIKIKRNSKCEILNSCVECNTCSYNSINFIVYASDKNKEKFGKLIRDSVIFKRDKLFVFTKLDSIKNFIKTHNFNIIIIEYYDDILTFLEELNNNGILNDQILIISNNKIELDTYNICDDNNISTILIKMIKNLTRVRKLNKNNIKNSAWNSTNIKKFITNRVGM